MSEPRDEESAEAPSEGDGAREPPPSGRALRPHDARMLDVGDGHWVYVEEIGRADGVPALFLHGGPGSGAQHFHRALFDPHRFRAFLLDQRGAGRSHPYLSLEANTTPHLVADLERIREHFGVDRWLLAGGSWGSTLGLAYAEAHPQRVLGLVMRAVFLGTDEEVRWAFIEGPKSFARTSMPISSATCRRASAPIRSRRIWSGSPIPIRQFKRARRASGAPMSGDCRC
jgi:proline iminopeptidase